MPANTVKVDRSTRWGNPFKPKADETARLAVGNYRDWIKGHYVTSKQPPSLDEIKTALKGKDLACWCKPGEYCHADVLLELANS